MCVIKTQFDRGSEGWRRLEGGISEKLGVLRPVNQYGGGRGGGGGGGRGEGGGKKEKKKKKKKKEEEKKTHPVILE